jgi:Methyltransferase FkbM domain
LYFYYDEMMKNWFLVVFLLSLVILLRYRPASKVKHTSVGHSAKGASQVTKCKKITENDVKRVFEGLSSTIKSCSGPENNIQCPQSQLGSFSDYTEKQNNDFDSAFVVQPGPWLNFGNVHFYGNFYSDYLIYELFFKKNRKPGVFFECGASNGVHASNTLFFEKYLGWTGLLIEATPCAICQLPHNRKNSKNIHGAICEAESIVDFSGMRVFCPSPQDGCVSEWPKTRCAPLQTFFDENKISHVDLFSLDVEDHHLTVLKSIDWKKVSMKVLFVECNKNKECLELIKSKGFTVLDLRGLWMFDMESDVLAYNSSMCFE